jgi:hypothetical protein
MIWWLGPVLAASWWSAWWTAWYEMMAGPLGQSPTEVESGQPSAPEAARRHGSGDTSAIRDSVARRLIEEALGDLTQGS